MSSTSDNKVTVLDGDGDAAAAAAAATSTTTTSARERAQANQQKFYVDELTGRAHLAMTGKEFNKQGAPCQFTYQIKKEVNANQISFNHKAGDSCPFNLDPDGKCVMGGGHGTKEKKEVKSRKRRRTNQVLLYISF
jgi:Flp pilus assembly protein TadG